MMRENIKFLINTFTILFLCGRAGETLFGHMGKIAEGLQMSSVKQKTE